MFGLSYSLLSFIVWIVAALALVRISMSLFSISRSLKELIGVLKSKP